MTSLKFADHWMFIPGPVNVATEIREAMARPPINHRGADFHRLFTTLRPKVQWIFQTGNAVHFSTSSAIGIMEGAIRNCVARRSLHLTCGAFSERWQKIAIACGKETGVCAVDWGQANRPETLRAELETGRYDTVCVVQSETSTAVQNPVAAIAAVLHDFPDVVFCLDTVSSLGASPVLVDEWGVDLCFASVQKGLALPPGFAIFSVSEKALARARTIEHRGYYFDFLTFEQFAEQSHTPTTPYIPHMYALDAQLDRIKTEGLDNRWERHRQLAMMTQEYADSHFSCFAEEGYRSAAVTAVVHNSRFDLAALNRHLEGAHMVVADGYGKLKESTFRIGHVGETQPAQLQTLFGEIDNFVATQS